MTVEPDQGPPPPVVRAAGALAGLQGAAGLAIGAVLVALSLTGPEPVVTTLATAGWFAVAGGAVLAIGVSLWRGRHGARSPAIVTQLLLLGVAWYATGPSSRPEYGVPGLVFCAAVLVLLFTPAAVRWAVGDGVDGDGVNGDGVNGTSSGG